MAYYGPSGQDGWERERDQREREQREREQREREQRERRERERRERERERELEQREENWFLDGEGIEHRVVQSDIPRYLGNDALVRRGVQEVRRKKKPKSVPIYGLLIFNSALACIGSSWLFLHSLSAFNKGRLQPLNETPPPPALWFATHIYTTHQFFLVILTGLCFSVFIVAYDTVIAERLSEVSD